MPDYREIVTKAVIGKGKRKFRTEHIIKSDEMIDSVLGCWVINHQFQAYQNKDSVRVDGSFDTNVWYSHSGDKKTAVANETINYSEDIPITMLGSNDILSSNSDVLARPLVQPTATSVDIVDGDIKLNVDKEFGIELIGETKFKVATEDLIESWPEEAIDIDDINTDFLG